MAGTVCVTWLRARGRPLIRTTTTGLPVPRTASTSSFCCEESSRSATSPRWLSAQASREVDSLVPITTTATSAWRATATASVMRWRFFTGSPKTTLSALQFGGSSVMRTPSA